MISSALPRVDDLDFVKSGDLNFVENGNLDFVESKMLCKQSIGAGRSNLNFYCFLGRIVSVPRYLPSLL